MLLMNGDCYAAVDRPRKEVLQKKIKSGTAATTEVVRTQVRLPMAMEVLMLLIKGEAGAG